MRFAFLIAAGFAALPAHAFAALPVHAYAGSFACPVTGVVAEMSDGSRFEFQGSDTTDHDTCVWRTVRSGNAWESRFIFAIHNVNNEVIEAGEMRQMLEAVFKPSSDGMVSAVLNNGKWNSSLKTVVTTSEDSVTVPAGTFAAIKVKVDGTGVFGNDGSVNSTYYLDKNTHVPVLIEENIDGHSFTMRAVKVTAPSR